MQVVASDAARKAGPPSNCLAATILGVTNPIPYSHDLFRIVHGMHIGNNMSIDLGNHVAALNDARCVVSFLHHGQDKISVAFPCSCKGRKCRHIRVPSIVQYPGDLVDEWCYVAVCHAIHSFYDANHRHPRGPAANAVGPGCPRDMARDKVYIRELMWKGSRCIVSRKWTWVVIDRGMQGRMEHVNGSPSSTT